MKLDKNNKKILSTFLVILILLSNVTPIFAAKIGDTLDVVYIGQCEEDMYYTRDGVTFAISTCYVGYYENGNFYPCYCLNRGLPGVDTEREYAVEVDDITKVSQNEGIYRVLLNGFPYKSAKEMGLETDTQAFAVTKQAIYSILDGRDTNNYSAKNATGKKMVEVVKRLVDIGRNGTQTYTDPVINAKAKNEAGVDNINANYISQTFYLTSQANMKNIKIMLNKRTIPEGTFVADENNNPKTTFNENESFKILVPRANIKSEINIQATIDGSCKTYPVLLGKAPSSSLQDYAMATDPYVISSTSLSMYYKPEGSIIINKVSSADSEITGIKKGEGLEGATFIIKAKDGSYETTKVTDAEGKIKIDCLELKEYIIEEIVYPDYYLGGKEGNKVEVELNTDGKIIEVTMENMPVDIEVEVDKSADKEEVQGREILTYSLDNIKNLSNVALNNFTLIDNLPVEVNLETIETGTYNHNQTYSVLYSTNKRSNIVFQDNLSTKTNNILDFSNLDLKDDEYITRFSFNFGTVKVGFKNTSKVNVITKVKEGLEDKSTFENNVLVSGAYLEATTEDRDEEPTKVYENILKIRKVSKEYNQYTDKDAGTAINATFELLDENKEYIDILNIKASEDFVYKYLETGKQFYLKEISTDDYYVISDKLIPFKFEENGQVIELVVENDNVNLVVDVEKEGPTQAEAGEIIQYEFNNVGNFSNTAVSNFIWGDKLPRQVRIQSIETGTWNEELTYKVQYITNRNTNWKTISEEYTTNENYTIDVSSESLNLPEGEYVKEFRFVFGEVKEGFQEVENPKVNVKVNEGLANNKIFVNDTYVTANYLETELKAEDDAHTIVYKKVDINKDELPKTGIDDFKGGN